MKVIYNTCYADPWVKVAQKLKEEHGWEPVYWVGYEDDDSKNIVPRLFPNCIYQDYYDAWKGIFPKEIEEKYAESYINIDFLREYASFELQAIKMMDRMDPDRYSFNFMERQRHFRRMLKYTTAILLKLKIDIVICDYIPHRLSDYVLYLLCKYYKIKYLCFREVLHINQLLPVTDLKCINPLLNDYEKHIKQNTKEELLKKLSKSFLIKYNDFKKQYHEAEPDYMKQQSKGHRKSSNVVGLALKFLFDIKKYSNRYFSNDKFIINGIPTYYKDKSRSIEKSKQSLFKYAILKLKNNKYKKQLHKYYQKKIVSVDFNCNYILFPLHYQPEMTSSPSGDIFVDQTLCIEMLIKNTPESYYIYVKEHRSQFLSYGEGHSGRIKEFYDDLLKYPRVKLISEKYDQFELIKNAIAVATITGTTGWESMALGKPVIIFGINWYEYYKGVLKITDEKSATLIENFITNFAFDEKALLAYIYELEKKSIKAYAYRGAKERIEMTEEECVNNLYTAVLENLLTN